METTLKDLFRIDNSSEVEIIHSFERISKELFTNYCIQVNSFFFLLTEIEFYYFYKGIHPDNNTHEHEFSLGRWRGHNQGLDITFESVPPDVSDGGILIRGIKQEQPYSENPYTNGPRRVVYKLFECFNDVITSNCGLYLKRLEESKKRELFRTSRQGIKEESYLKSKYRYFTELDNWDWKTLGSTYRNNIERDKEPLK